MYIVYIVYIYLTINKTTMKTATYTNGERVFVTEYIDSNGMILIFFQDGTDSRVHESDLVDYSDELLSDFIITYNENGIELSIMFYKFANGYIEDADNADTVFTTLSKEELEEFYTSVEE